MQENRSFDHYFGAMRGVRGYGDPHPVTLPNGQPVLHQADGTQTCCRSAPMSDNLGLTVHRGPRPRLGRRPPDVQRRRLGPVAAGQDDDLMAHMKRSRHPVPLRAGRRVHRLRRLPLLDARADRHQPLLHVDRLGRQRRQGRRPGDRQRRGRLQLADLPGAAAGGRVSAGRSTRTSASGLDAAGVWGWTDGSLHRQLRRQLAAVLRQLPATPRPAARCTERARTGTDVNNERRLLRHPRAPTSSTASSRRSPGSSRPRRTPSTRAGPPTTAPGTWRGAQRADQRPRGVGEDGAADHLRRERRLLRPRRRRRTPTSAAEWQVDGAARRRVVRRHRRHAGRLATASPAPTASACACRCSSSRPGARAAGSARRRSTTPR